MSSEVTFRVDPSSVYQALIRDRFTNDWRKDLFQWTAIVVLQWDAKKLPVIGVANSETEDRSSEGPLKWTPLLLHAAVSSAKADVLSAFEENSLTYRVPAEVADSTQHSVTAFLPEKTMERLNQQSEIDQRARKGYEEAVDRLEDLMRYGQVSAEARTLFSYIEHWLDAGYVGHNYSWYQEKRARIRRNMNDLERRKNRNHPGFISAKEDVGSQLCMFTPPIAWLQRPPLFDLATAR